MDANSKQLFSIVDAKQQISAITVFAIFLAILWGLALGLTILPILLPGMSQSILTTQPKVFWYLSRSSALVAYGLLWFSMVLGVSVTNKLASRWPGLAKTNGLHQYVSILGLAFGLFHGLILLGDKYTNFSVVQILIPFTTGNYRPLAVGLGQIGFYLWGILLVSYYVRRLIGAKAWRLIHYFSYLTYISVLIHGLTAGTDANSQAVQMYFWITGGILLFLTVYRVLYEINIHSEKQHRKTILPLEN